MNLTVNSKIVADLTISGASLGELLGAYELTFPLQIRLHPRTPDSGYWLMLHGARVCARAGGGAREQLGDARPMQPVRLRQFDNPLNLQASFAVVLQPYQLAKLEDLRDGGELAFDLVFSGVGGLISEMSLDTPIQEEFHHRVPKSEWVKQLHQAGAINIQLLEVPVPIAGLTENQRRASDLLQAAQVHFAEGNYKSCIGDCREILEMISKSELAILKLLSTDQNKGMTKGQREAAIFAVIRHYTHLAHHGAGVGEEAFSRSDAKFLLHLVTVCLGFASTP